MYDTYTTAVVGYDNKLTCPQASFREIDTSEPISELNGTGANSLWSWKGFSHFLCSPEAVSLRQLSLMNLS